MKIGNNRLNIFGRKVSKLMKEDIRDGVFGKLQNFDIKKLFLYCKGKSLKGQYHGRYHDFGQKFTKFKL